MTNKKTTKRALLLSVVSMLICVAMLVGTTFAWFTDTVVSGRNQIVAGNLDIELTHTNEFASDADVEGNTALFVDAGGKSILWEPGVVAYENFTVKNVGNLALKYQLDLTIFDEQKTPAGKSLSEVIKVAYVPGGVEATASRADLTALTNWSEIADIADADTLDKGETKTTGVVLYWAPTANDNDFNLKNEWQNQPDLFIEFGLNLFATQNTVEEDSFDNQYDVNAPYTEIATLDDLEDAFENGGEFILTKDIALTEAPMAREDVVIDLNGKKLTAPANGTVFKSQSNAAPSMTISSSKPGAEINVSGGADSVILGYGNTVVENVTINVAGGETPVLLGYGSTVFENVTINLTGANQTKSPFNAHADLTLGKGTVVNVDYLGTSLISNSGAHKIVIDGADINIGDFVTNGGSVISLNKASTLEIKDTDINIDNFVPSTFGGEKLVSKADGVTIANDCSIVVKDATNAEYNVVVKSGATGNYYGFAKK